MNSNHKSVYLTLSGLHLANPVLRGVLERLIHSTQNLKLFNTIDQKTNHRYYHSGISIVTTESFESASDLIDELEFGFHLSDEMAAAPYDRDAVVSEIKIGPIKYRGRTYVIDRLTRKRKVLCFSFVAKKDDKTLEGDDKAIDQGTKKDCCEPRSMLAS